ncbi:DNA helicase [Enterobacter phage N5822]|nr:DNA helicase [Enterobacter phage N5822]
MPPGRLGGFSGGNRKRGAVGANDHEKGEIVLNGDGSRALNNDGEPMEGTGRTQYTLIIREMQRRCKETYGHELRIFGMTGSEFRGVVPIWWKISASADSGASR